MKVKKEKDCYLIDNEMIKKLILFLVIGLVIASCSNDGPKEVKIGKKEKIVSAFANETPQIVREFEDKDGAPIAVYEKEYYEDGNLLKEGPIDNNKRHGNWKTYYRSGKTWNELTYYEGTLDDTIKGYYTNGTMKYQGIYNKGQKTGVWLFFDEEGNLKENKVYMQPGEKREDTLRLTL